MIPTHSPLASTINPSPPNDRRRPGAAESPPRRLPPSAGELASGTGPRPPFECIALLLQGGGALGAYQAGVYEALTEVDLQPDWVAGISIGAIIGALIAGNAPETRVDRLRAFWERITAQPWWRSGVPTDSLLRGDAARQWLNQVNAAAALVAGPRTLSSG